MITFNQEMKIVKYFNRKPLVEIKNLIGCKWSELVEKLPELSLSTTESSRKKYIAELCKEGFNLQEISKALQMKKTEVYKLMPINYQKKEDKSKAEYEQKKSAVPHPAKIQTLIPPPPKPKKEPEKQKVIAKPFPKPAPVKSKKSKYVKKLVLNERYYTNKQDEFIENNYGKIPIETIAAKLGRTVASVRWRANILGKSYGIDNTKYMTFSKFKQLLKITSKNFKATCIKRGLPIIKAIVSQRSYDVIDIYDILTFLKNNQDLFDSRKVPLDTFGSEPMWLTLKRQEDEKKLQYNRVFTKEQDKIIDEKFGKVSLEELAKEVGRPIASVKWRAKILGKGFGINNTEYMTFQKFAGILKLDSKVFKRKCLKRGLPIYTVKISTRDYTVVKPDEALHFLKENQDVFDGRNVETGALGSEPDWLIEKRKKDKKNPPKTYEFYSDKEKKFIQKSIEKGMSYSQIASKLNRGVASVKSFCYANGMKKQPVYMKYADYISTNYKTKTYQQIADELNAMEAEKDSVLTRDMIVDYARRIGLPKKHGSPEPMKAKSQFNNNGHDLS